MAMTFSQTVETVLATVRSVAPLNAGTMSREVLRSYALGALWDNGALCPSEEHVARVVDAVRAELAAEEAGQVVVLDRSGNGLHLVLHERAPVCPRCLDIEPGTPGGTPDEPHPGPFTRDLCAPCERRSGPGGA